MIFPVEILDEVTNYLPVEDNMKLSLCSGTISDIIKSKKTLQKEVYYRKIAVLSGTENYRNWTKWAAQNGRVDILQKLNEFKFTWYVCDIFEAYDVAKKNYSSSDQKIKTSGLKVLQWLLSGFNWQQTTVNGAPYMALSV
jgi:hypothetical protein